ncbi:MAG TPA: adenylate/guanylate cyclase domain-containing protein, partial [Mycobacterium sp.]|nr:adenylate/guanylate cyclase domain-containing protein [Mycobacterium sp.]
MLQADIIGALFVLGYLRFGLPHQDRVVIQDLPQANLALFGAVLFLAFTFGSLVSLRLLMPVFRWQRRDRDGMLDGDPVSTELARTRALKMPFYRSVISAINWFLG